MRRSFRVRSSAFWLSAGAGALACSGADDSGAESTPPFAGGVAGLGHQPALYQNPLFTQHLLGGIRWAAGMGP